MHRICKKKNTLYFKIYATNIQYIYRVDNGHDNLYIITAIECKVGGT